MIEIYDTKTANNQNTNSTDTKTGALDVQTCDELTFYVFGTTGDHANHIVALEFSADGTNFIYSNRDITGLGSVSGINVQSVHSVRLKVTTPEGTTSTCGFVIQASRKK